MFSLWLRPKTIQSPIPSDLNSWLRAIIRPSHQSMSQGSDTLFATFRACKDHLPMREHNWVQRLGELIYRHHWLLTSSYQVNHSPCLLNSIGKVSVIETKGNLLYTQNPSRPALPPVCIKKEVSPAGLTMGLWSFIITWLFWVQILSTAYKLPNGRDCLL